MKHLGLLAGLLVLVAVTMPSGVAPGVNLLEGGLYAEVTPLSVGADGVGYQAVASSNIVPVNQSLVQSCTVFRYTDEALCYTGTATRASDQTLYTSSLTPYCYSGPPPRPAPSTGCGLGTTFRDGNGQSWTGEGVIVGVNTGGQGWQPLVYACPIWNPATSAMQCYGINTVTNGAETCVLLFERTYGLPDSQREIICLFA